MTKVKTKNEKGITLVALIITIIVLIILAAVSIVHMLNLQIIGQAVNGTQDYSSAQYDEKNEMVNIANMIESTIAGVKNNQGGVKDPQDPTPETPPVTLTTDSDIGKYVDYTPEAGSYTAEGRYSGYVSNNQTFSTETDMKWRIWKVDSDNLYLISDRPTNSGGYNSEGKLYLAGREGYNNGVTLLDNICSNCYNNSSYSGMTARSWKVEDIEEVTTYDYTSYENYNESPNTYTGIYPYIWGEYESSSIENRSTAYSLTTETSLPEQTFTPKFSYWNKRFLYQSADKDWDNPKYYELIFCRTDNTNRPSQWLSSRAVDKSTSSSTDCNFLVMNTRCNHQLDFQQHASYHLFKWHIRTTKLYSTFYHPTIKGVFYTD